MKLIAVRPTLSDAVTSPNPVCEVQTIANERASLLFWVRTGRARVKVEGFERLLSTGEAIWIPARIPHRITVESGSVAFPILQPNIDTPAGLNRVMVLSVPPSWADWLVFQFAHGIGYLRGAVPTGPSLLELIAGSRVDPAEKTSSSPHPITQPVLPLSPAAIEVARTLLRTPNDPTDLAGFAARFQVGIRTLQRQFTQETGMSFIRWRTAARVAAAAAYLDAGQSVGSAAQHVGFTTPAGFTRAFREHAGCNPSDYAANRVTRRKPVERTLASELITLSLCTAATETATDLSAPPIPVANTWKRVNAFHVVVWVYRGTARITIGERTWRLRRGDTMWLPAGIRNSVEIAPNSLLLPLAEHPGTSPRTAPRPKVGHFPLSAEDWLLHTMVANYTLVRPEGFDNQAIMRLIYNSSQTNARSTINPHDLDPVQQILAAIHHDPADTRTLTEWATELNIDATAFNKQFIETVGQSFPLWRAGLRMTRACKLLDAGALSGEVARRLGYAHPSGFIQVFTKAHGMSPRAYQQRKLKTEPKFSA